MAENYTNEQVTPDPSNSGDQSAGSAPPEPASNAPQTPSPVSPTEQPVVSLHHKRRKLPWILLAVLIIVIAGGGFYAYHVHKNNQTSFNGKKDIPLIRYAFDNNPLNVFYPSDNSIVGLFAVQTQLFEGLVAFQNGTDIRPQLASSWSNPNNNTWIFKLKPNIYYHDGNTVTAQDVVYTWQQINKNSPQLASTLTSSISNVKAIDSSTVEITTSQPDAILLNKLASLYIIDSKAPAHTPAWELGTGAYTVKAGTNPSANNLDIVAFNKWHGGHIYTKEVDYTFYADPSKGAKAVEAGKADLADLIGLNDVNSQIRQKYNVFTTPQTYTVIMQFNTTKSGSPTTNSKIRQALDLAINKQTALSNSGEVGTVNGQVLPPSIPGYNPSIKPTQQDITQAAALVKAAGYPNGVTINLGVGEPLAALGQELAKQVKPAGITLNLQVATDEGQYFNNVNNGTYPAWMVSVGTNILDGSDVFSSSFSNVPYYSNATFNSQFNSAQSTFDAVQRLKYLQDASLTLVQDHAYVPIFQEDDLNISNKGFVFPLTNYDQDLNAYFADVYQQ